MPEHLTSGTGSGSSASWASPCAQMANGEPEAFLERKRRSVARGNSMGISLTDLNMQVKAAQKGMWPTPNTRGFNDDGAMAMLAEACDSFEEMSGMAYRQNKKKKEKYWPTPTVVCATGGQTSRSGDRKGELLLAGAVKQWPTPRAEDSQCAGGHRGKDDTLYGMVCRPKETKNFPTPIAGSSHYGGTMGEWGGSGNTLRQTDPDLAGGSLNPTWVCWLMGWPLGWTSMEPLPPETWAAWQWAFRIALEDSRQSEMDRCQPSQHSHGGCSHD